MVKEYATRLNVDTQEALAAQYQAATAHDQAVIDNARVQLGYTTIVSPLAGRTGIRLIDQRQHCSCLRFGRPATIAVAKPDTHVVIREVSECFRGGLGQWRDNLGGADLSR